MRRSILNRRNATFLATGTGFLAIGLSVIATAGRIDTDGPSILMTRKSAVSPAADVPASGASVATMAAVEPARPATGLGPEWDLPNVDHARVDYWVERFAKQPSLRSRFQGFLDRGATLAPMILDRLEARDMPRDLLYLAMIESGFQPHATSHAAAVGVWQFIRATGVRYGLDVDRAVDERRDPVRATDAALDYLQDLHDRFGSWYLAAAAYNCGEGRVSRAMRAQFGRERAKSESDYYAIWHRLPRETREYVPLMIASARLAKGAEGYGFKPMQPAPIEWDEITVPPATPLREIATEYGTTVDELRSLNPHLLIHRTPNNRHYPVRLPAGAVDRYARSQTSGSINAE